MTDTRLYDAWGNVRDATGTTEMQFRFVGKLGYVFDAELDKTYVKERWYDAKQAIWTTPDPIVSPSRSVDEPWPDGTLYTYVRNQPLDFVDPSGLDFIAIADRPVGGLLGTVYHYSLQYWICCPGFKPLCHAKGFSRDEILEKCSLAGNYPSDKIDSFELLNNPGWSVWGGSDLLIGVRVWKKKTANVAVIQYTDTSNRFMPIIDGTAAKVRPVWDRMALAAQSYGWAEQDAKDALAWRGPFTRWPQSLYKALGTNSNTFVRHIVRSAGLPMCEMSWPHPGADTPTQNLLGDGPIGYLHLYVDKKPWKAPMAVQPRPPRYAPWL